MGIIINRGANNSGRSTPSGSVNTGFMFYGTAPTNPAWLTATNPVSIKYAQILSAAAALSAGITPNTDNAAPTGTIVISTKGNTGDVITVTCTFNAWNTSSNTIVATTFTLCSYTVTSGASSITLQVTAITAAINALTFQTGFSAVASLGTTITMIAPTYVGILLNTGSPYTITTSAGAAFVTVLTQNVIAGTPSLYAAAYYHISEYYRVNPTGNLTIGFISASSSWKELPALEIASGNTLYQIYPFDTNTSHGLAANIENTVTAIQAAVSSIQTPFEVIWTPNISAVSDLTTLPNGNNNTTGTNVELIIPQDGAAQGYLLYQASGYSIGNMGVHAGCLSASRVSSSIAQPIQQWNVSDGVENAVPGLSNGTLLSALSTSLYQQLFGTVQNNINGYCYIGFATYAGLVSGTFFSGNAMFTSQSSEYANMNDNRVWDEVTRIIIATYTPYLNSEIQNNADGTISNTTIINWQVQGVNAITAQMITGQNPPLLTNPNVVISPDQDVNATGVINIGVSYGENPIVRNIEVTSGPTN